MKSTVIALFHLPPDLLAYLPPVLRSRSFYPFTSTDLPSTPGNPVAIRNTDTSVVVTWGASKEVKQLVGYYIECSEVGTDVWMPCNNKPVKQTRYAHCREVRNDAVTHSR